MTRNHTYRTLVTWTGNTGAGTNGYRSYERSYELSTAAKQVINGSSDPLFRGDTTRWNPGGVTGRRNLSVPPVVVSAPLL